MMYSDDLSVREAREIYFKNSGFDQGTYTDRWVKFPVLGRTIYLPNIKLRRDAVPLHDIDHVLTEYKTDWEGEWQICSYELGTGCGTYWGAWLINAQAIMAGGIRAPKACLKAFARGRRSKGVFSFTSVEPLLEQRLSILRERTTAPEGNIHPNSFDFLLFFSLVIAAYVVHLVPIAAIIFLSMEAFK